MRRLALICALIVTPVIGLAATAGADDTHTYEIEMYNAFGIVEGSQVRIAGVNAGIVKELDINAAKRAIVTVELSGELGVLGTETKCSSEPQSLIAEYFISCEPAGPPIDEDDDVDDPQPDIPASRVAQTVQNDLVQNTLRLPFRERLTLIINEFGTALAGDPDSLNEAVRLGAPALTQLRKVTQILASQNTIIRDLNANSDEVIGRLAARRDDVVRFIREARDTAEISVTRREDLSRNFEILDDFLAELRPTLVELDNLAVEQTPLLTDLRAAAPGLNRLAVNLPPFNSASEASLASLGSASAVGEQALRRGSDEIAQLAEAGKNAPATAEILADFLRDVDDPRRAVEIDDRVPADTGRDNPQPGQKDTKGYTGLEGLLNYVYYQAGSLNQYDQIGHMLHFSLYNVDNGPCGSFSSGRDPETGEPGVPAEDGGTTTNILEADNCVAWLGPNQPGISEPDRLPPYDPSVCPNGTEPHAAESLCHPEGSARHDARSGGRSPDAGRGDGTADQQDGGGNGGGGGGAPAPEAPGGPVPDDILDQILDLPPEALDQLPDGLQDELGGALNQGGQNGGTGTDGGADAGGGAAEDLLDFLFSS
jgi:ABC-type transporter Mla subunit MlaD